MSRSCSFSMDECAYFPRVDSGFELSICIVRPHLTYVFQIIGAKLAIRLDLSFAPASLFATQGYAKLRLSQEGARCLSSRIMRSTPGTLVVESKKKRRRTRALCRIEQYIFSSFSKTIDPSHSEQHRRDGLSSYPGNAAPCAASDASKRSCEQRTRRACL